MNKEKFLDELRELWRTNQHDLLKKRYFLGRWMLSEDKQKEMDAIIGINKPKKQDPLIEFALQNGCKIEE